MDGFGYYRPGLTTVLGWSKNPFTQKPSKDDNNNKNSIFVYDGAIWPDDHFFGADDQAYDQMTWSSGGHLVGHLVTK